MDHAAALEAVAEGQQRMLRDAPSRDWAGRHRRRDLAPEPTNIRQKRLCLIEPAIATPLELSLSKSQVDFIRSGSQLWSNFSKNPK